MNPVFNVQRLDRISNLRFFKGSTDISFILDDLFYNNKYILKLTMDFNDGTPLLERSFDFLNKDHILEPIHHRFNTSNKYHYIVYYPTLYITYADFTRDAFQFPIRIAKESFYSDHKLLNVSNCQFIDDSDNSMFVTLETSSGDILNLKIK